MNTGSIHHLDIGDLLAEVDGTLCDERARTHLDSCPHCRKDAEGWRKVGLGVNYLSASIPAPATPTVVDGLLSSADRGVPFVRQTEPGPVVGRSRRGVRIGAAAGVLLVMAGGSYGLTVAVGGKGPRPASSERPTVASAGLTSVNGCPDLAATSGTLERVNGSDLLIATSEGQSVTITTSPSTEVGSQRSGSLDNITNGAEIVVNGTESNGTITAATAAVGDIGKLKLVSPPKPPGGLKLGLASGTVTDVHTGQFTVIERNGTAVPVIASGSTTVITLTTIAVNQLQVGELTVAVGAPGQGPTLNAAAVEQDTVPASSQPTLPTPVPWPQHAKNGRGDGAVSPPTVGCSPSAVATAALGSAD